MKSLSLICLSLFCTLSLIAQNSPAALDKLVQTKLGKKFERFTEYEVYPASGEDAVLYGDFNGDARVDIAAIYWIPCDQFSDDDALRSTCDSTRYLAIAFNQPDGLKLNTLSNMVLCRSCGGAYGDPLESLSWGEDKEIMINFFGGSSWKWSQGYSLKHTPAGFVVNSSSDNWFYMGVFGGDAVTDYENNTISETTWIDLTESGKEIKEQAMEAVLLEITKGIELLVDGKSTEHDWRTGPRSKVADQEYVTFGQSNWSGPADLSFETAMRYDTKGLYLNIKVKDDKRVPYKKSLLACDHVELWFDLDYSKVAMVDGDYELAELRTKPDAKTFQLAVLPKQGGACSFRQFYPEGKEQEDIEGMVGYSSETKDGWEIEFLLPFTVFENIMQESMNTGDNAFMNMTITISDSDNAEQPKQETMMATSNLKWGNPCTFGKAFFKERVRKPIMLSDLPSGGL
jgi:hypothetical protein